MTTTIQMHIKNKPFYIAALALTAVVAYMAFGGRPPVVKPDAYFMLQSHGTNATLITPMASKDFCVSMLKGDGIASPMCVAGVDLVKAEDKRFYGYSTEKAPIEKVIGAFSDENDCKQFIRAATTGGYICGRLG